MPIRDTFAYLGGSYNWPFRVTELGRLELVSGKLEVEQSLLRAVLTSFGDRMFQREYGTRIYAAMFQANDTVSHAIIRKSVFDALSRYEGRVSVQSVSVVASNENTVQVTVNYELRGLRDIQKFVFSVSNQ
jgi:phage baseplate assembly protein W